MGVCGYAQVCAGVLAGVRGHTRMCVCIFVTGVCGFSNNYEFSEYLLEINVFMQWPLV